MWHDSDDLEVEDIPMFPHTASHRHYPSHRYARTSMSGSETNRHPFHILHPADDCTHCRAYNVHVMFACLFDDGFEGWTGTGPGYTEGSPELYRVQTILRRVKQERDDAIALNIHYRSEVALLEKQLREANDRLLAIDIAYGDETRPWDRDFFGEESRVDELLPEEVEQVDDLQHNLDLAMESDDLWTTENPIVQSDTVSNASWNDSSDEFDFLQQLHMMTQEDDMENPWEDISSNEALQEHLETTTDSSSNPPSPSTSSSSSLLSESDLVTNESDDSSLFSPTKSTSSDQELSDTLKLMTSAHEEGNITALAEIKKLIVQAEKTPRHFRTKAQKYILLNWRSPNSSRRNSPKGLEIFVDASSVGIGFVFGTQCLSWMFTNTSKLPLGGDGRVVMSWAELLAVELGLRALIAAGYRSMTITIRSDNTGVIDALEKKSWCQKYGIETILQNILSLCRENEIQLKPSWVSTKENLADMPSRGVFPPWSHAFKFPPKLPTKLTKLLKPIVPETA